MVLFSLGRHRELLRTRQRRHQAARKPRPLYFEALESRTLLTGTWTALTNPAPSPNGTGTMMLLSDGTVMVQGGGSAGAVKTWYRLSPDASGSYVNGTWAPQASMSLERLYYASNLLPDGRVFLVGGEYSDPNTDQNFTNTGEIYDPVADTWTSIQNFPNTQFGDDPSALLPDGRVLAGYLSAPQTYIYDPASNTWSQAATKLNSDRSDEETWVKLPDDSILTYDVFAKKHSQRYIPSQDQWVDAGVLPYALSGNSSGRELGPAFLLPDGRVFFTAANRHTALYDPSTNSWTAGPDRPSMIGSDDAPGAELPNGHVLFASDQLLFSPPTVMFDFDPTTNSLSQLTVPTSVGLANVSAYVTRMLMLPTGQVLFTNASDQLFVYTPDGGPDPSWAPSIAGINANEDGTFTLTGTQLNGISEGACYGDDAEMSSNYPLVRLTDGSGNVFYARTFNWSSTGVATGATPVSTEFVLPAGIPAGDYALEVVANGIASVPVPFTVSPGPDSTQGYLVFHGHPAATGTPVAHTAFVPPLAFSPPASPGVGPADAETSTVPPSPHGFLPNGTSVDDLMRAMAQSAPEQLATSFAWDRPAITRPEPAPTLETPLHGPLPEDLSAIP